MSIFKDRRFSIVWALLRIWLGYNWLTSGIEKLGSPAWTGNSAGTAITGFFNGVVSKSQGQYAEVQGWYADLIKSIAMPNAKILTYVIPVAETLVGISLILGALTIVGLIGSALMNFSYLLAGAGGINTIMYTLAIILLVVGANVYFLGLDQIFVMPLLRRWSKRRPSYS